MNFKELFDYLEDDAARRRLEDLLLDHTDSFNLDSFCHRGGYADVEEIRVSNFERTDESIKCRVCVEFTETITTSCAAVDVNFNKSCDFDITIDRDGEVEVGEIAEGWDGQEYGEQDFDDDVEFDETSETDEH